MEKLAQLIYENSPRLVEEESEILASKLIDRGVIFLPCKVGDRLYTVYCKGVGDWFIQESIVSEIKISEDFGIQITEKRKGTFGEYFYYRIDIDQMGESIFLSREEAEEHLPQSQKENANGTT